MQLRCLKTADSASPAPTQLPQLPQLVEEVL